MDLKKILFYVDHTLLKQDVVWSDIQAICEDGMKYETASVCIPASFVKQAKEFVGDKLAICTVIGFPNGYSTTAAKVFEAKDAVENGADEVDMVINIGWAKAGLYDNIEDEIRQIKEAVGEKVLKVIVETCLLNEEEKVKLCEVVAKAGADFIKTSTGFSTSGATFEDVEIFKKAIDENVEKGLPRIKIKAAGGISSLEDAQKFLDLGAERLGTSRVVKIVKAAA